MELRLAVEEDLPRLRAVYRELVEQMDRGGGVCEEVLEDGAVLREFGFERETARAGTMRDRGDAV